VAHLSKCFTYNDIQLMRFSVDFGLGVYNGIELATLPQGQVVRRDIIERSVSFELILISSNSYFSSSFSFYLLVLLLSSPQLYQLSCYISLLLTLISKIGLFLLLCYILRQSMSFFLKFFTYLLISLYDYNCFKPFVYLFFLLLILHNY
jgi:hypothetical protein